jgi:hypothetical protein
MLKNLSNWVNSYKMMFSLVASELANSHSRLTAAKKLPIRADRRKSNGNLIPHLSNFNKLRSTGKTPKRPIHSQLNWAILLCDAIPEEKTEKTAQFWLEIGEDSELSFPFVFHTENCAVHSANPTVSSVNLPTTPWHHHKKTHGTDEKTDKPDRKPVLCHRTFSKVFRAVFYKVKIHSLTLSTYMGPFRLQAWWNNYMS